MSRTCPHCGFSEDSARERCSRCGRSVQARPPRLRGRRRVVVLAAGAAAVAVLAIVAVVVGSNLNADRRERERADLARAQVAERARLRRLQAPHRGDGRDLRPPAGAEDAQRRAARAALVDRAEALITRDARARVRSGEIKGPISATECGPFLRAPDAVPDDRVLTKAIGRYDCVAVKADIRGRDDTSVGRLGYAFVAALDFDRFTLTWCRNTPAQSEAGKALAQVRLDRACLAAKGAPLGAGYVDVPGS